MSLSQIKITAALVALLANAQAKADLNLEVCSPTCEMKTQSQIAKDLQDKWTQESQFRYLDQIQSPAGTNLVILQYVSEHIKEMSLSQIESFARKTKQLRVSLANTNLPRAEILKNPNLLTPANGQLFSEPEEYSNFKIKSQIYASAFDRFVHSGKDAQTWMASAVKAETDFMASQHLYQVLEARLQKGEKIENLEPPDWLIY